MKTKLFLAALALPLVFGACSNDELLSTNEAVQKNGDLVEVGPDFVISATKGEAGGTTRAAWEKNDAGQLLYLWKPVAPSADGPAILDRIGLCWVGKTASDVVYTNYEFTHNGWLVKDELKANVEPCDGYVKNGYNFHNVTYVTADTKFVNTDAASAADDDFLSSSNIKETQYVTFTPRTANNGTAEATYDMRSAFFKTSAQTLFGGDYIAYFPFNTDLKDEGCIPATSPVVFDVDATPANVFAHLSKEHAMFAYGYAPALVGGTTANDFSFYNLSGLIRVRLNGAGVTDNTASVALVDADGKFISKVNLSAQKIIANKNNPTAGKAIYMSGTEEYTNMLSATITNPQVNGNTDVWFSALPTTTGALKVVVYDSDKTKSAVYDAPAITVTPGGVATVNVTVASAADFTKNIAINEASLKAMATANVTPITLLGDIELTASWPLDKSVTVEGGRIIIPAAAKNAAAAITMTVTGNKANIKSDILIEGQGCCGAYPGKLVVGESTTGNKAFTFEGTIDNYGEIEFIAGADVDNKNVTDIKGNLNNLSQYIKENDDTQYGEVTLNSLATVNVSSKLQNNAVFTIKGTGNANEDGTLVISGTVTNAYQMSNGGNINNNGTIANTAEGWFTDKIGSQFGGKQFDNTAEGQYVCEVNGQNRLGLALNENLRPTTRVRFTDTDALPSGATPKKFDLSGVNSPNVDFEILSKDAITFKSTAASPADVTIGNLIVTKNALTIEKTGIKTLKTNSISVDGNEAGNVTLQCDVAVTNSVVLAQMANGTKVAIGGTQDGTSNVYAKTTMTVGADFIVGDATPKSTKKAEVEFLNNNTTKITGSFDLNKTGKCTILVATTASQDNYAAEVWCKTLNQNGGTWGNNSWPKVY
ncbi:MAG: hypothetical protein BACD_04206 [Bacteroides rodentium]